MRSLIIAAMAAASVAVLAGASPAEARDYPYCLQGEQQGYPGDCNYASLQQCEATASGTNSDCGINPLFAFGYEQDRRHHHESRAQW